jgi:cytochrome c biogenesis protein ResB
VQVLKGDDVIKSHTIRVNGPLVYEGVKFSQFGYDERSLQWTRLGVSRDHGVWFVYAGFLATMIGLVGRFYLKPIIHQRRSDSSHTGGHHGVD